jgi:hypothetical protein
MITSDPFEEQILSSDGVPEIGELGKAGLRWERQVVHALGIDSTA